MGTIAAYPAPTRTLDGSELLAGFQDGQQVAIPTSDIASFAAGVLTEQNQAILQPLVAQAQAAGAAIPASVTASARMSTEAAVNRGFNLCPPGAARVGYIDNGAGTLVGATDWCNWTVPVTPGGPLTLSHHPSASTGYYFTDGTGARIGGNANGITIGDGPTGNTLTFVSGGFQIPVPAGAIFAHLSVPAAYVGQPTDVNLMFVPRFVVLDGAVTLGAAALYDPASTRGQRRWAGRKLFVQGDSFWHQREWPLDLAGSLGWASMVRAFRGGRQMSQGLTRAVNSIANATNAADTGSTDVGIAAADVAGIDAFVLALHTNDAAAGIPVGAFTDAPAIFDANGLMTSGGATYFSRARGVIETLVGWNPRMLLILGTPIYRVNVPLIADYQAAIETLGSMYGAAVCRPDRKFGVNAITAANRLADGTHPPDADFTAIYQPCWRDGFETVSPLT